SLVPLEPLTVDEMSEKLVTDVPRTAKLSKSFNCRRVSDTLRVLLRKMPAPSVAPSAPVLCWICPPEPAPAAPVTVSPPDEPVLLVREMPPGVPVVVMGPERTTDPAVRFLMSTARPAELVMAPP